MIVHGPDAAGVPIDVDPGTTGAGAPVPAAEAPVGAVVAGWPAREQPVNASAAATATTIIHLERCLMGLPVFVNSPHGAYVSVTDGGFQLAYR